MRKAGPTHRRYRSSDAHTLIIEAFLALGAAIGVGLTAVMLRAGW